jgi:hypothetical protein
MRADVEEHSPIGERTRYRPPYLRLPASRAADEDGARDVVGRIEQKAHARLNLDPHGPEKSDSSQAWLDAPRQASRGGNRKIARP